MDETFTLYVVMVKRIKKVIQKVWFRQRIGKMKYDGEIQENVDIGASDYSDGQEEKKILLSIVYNNFCQQLTKK